MQIKGANLGFEKLQIQYFQWDQIAPTKWGPIWATEGVQFQRFFQIDKVFNSI